MQDVDIHHLYKEGFDNFCFNNVIISSKENNWYRKECSLKTKGDERNVFLKTKGDERNAPGDKRRRNLRKVGIPPGNERRQKKMKGKMEGGSGENKENTRFDELKYKKRDLTLKEQELALREREAKIHIMKLSNLEKEYQLKLTN
ncbi:hypothetical protein C1645_814559 [Glomus cerebriforme]|uniref:No apical meristem-associated C-terminal domain-containing protein n=1 Tax=Glomus cerebriforme TaxID=658196 RepID=A0A397TQA1_9GLOM|nr:hypothetical protein C1645_814559 [Glomus cerebriforme]